MLHTASKLHKKSGVLLACSVLFLTGCAAHTEDPYFGNNPDYIYAVGHQNLKDGHYSSALTAYQSLDSQYPFTDYSKKGDLESIYAYYANENPAMAVTAASRYLKVYPGDPNAAYAYYMMGVVDFDNGRGFLQKYFPYDMSQHDAENYTQAFHYFNTVSTQYPKSPYADDAHRRMIYLNNTMAQYNLNVAQFLFEQKAYVAAINRAQIVILNYPTTPQTEDALKLISNAYTALGIPDLAIATNTILQLNFSSQ